MSDKEDCAKGYSDNLSQTAASGNDVMSTTQDPSMETISVTKKPQMAAPFSNSPTVKAVSDSLEMEAISDVDDPLAMEAVSDTDDTPPMEAVSDADDTPAMEAVSDADDTHAMEAVSDADDTHAMEAVSDADDTPAMEAVSDADDTPAMEALSDTDDLPAVEAVSDADDLPAMEAVFDSDDLPPPAIKAISDAGDPPPMEAVSDSDDAVLDTGNPLSKPVTSVDLLGLADSTSDACLIKDAKFDQFDGVSTSPNTDVVSHKSVDCDVEKKSVEMDISQNNSVPSSSETAECAEDNKTLSSSGIAISSLDKELKNNESSEAYATNVHYTVNVKEKNSKSGEEKGDVSSKQSSNTEVQELGNNSTSLKTSAVVSSVQAEFSDNEESGELSPQHKLLEVIFKEDEDDDNMDAFIPEVECTVEDAEGNSDGLTSAQSEGDCEKFITAEDTVLNATESESALEVVAARDDTDDGNHETNANGATEEDAFADVTSSYSAESCDVDETMQTYAKEFLYSDTSSLGPEPDVTSSEVGKRPNLSRFPQIAKAVGAADYSLLQEMYRLLYLRNPWDTKEVLSSRILDFSGFHFSQDSEDYFNREVILRGMPQKTLESIAHLLCFSKPISARSNKQRVHLATRIMKFLKSPEKPKRNRPASSTTAKAKQAAISVKPVSTPDVVEPSEKAATPKPAKPRSRKSAPSRLLSKSSKKETEVKVKTESMMKESTTIPVTERNISPGKMKWLDLKLPEVKVELTKMELSEIRKATKIKVNEAKRSSPVGETSFSDSNSKTSKPGDADEATDTDTSEQVLDDEIKKLKEFPEVLSNIEGTPEKILSDIHYLLYLEDASLKDLKSNVMEFRGFPVEDGPNEVEERKQFLDKMSDNIIKNLASTFYLKCTNDKEENINLIIGFLKAPSKRYMKEAAEAPDKMLSERNTDLMDGLSDSDDSITCEIVPKKVDCIDLISSGEEEEEEEQQEQEEKEKKEEKVQVKKEELPGRPSKRCLHDFETITKIVNTHPHEYLIDIYNLVYQRTCEPSTLRKEILEFSGFEFEKGSDEYVKRKQYLDRMQYNNVRRIFNTLIHNTRDVRVFSKPTMIGEIFQFLFKLPDTDTSIRPPPQKTSVVLPVTPKEKEKVAVNPTPMNVANKGDPPQASNSTRLSELKRVFQRVACFPCEYLVDVHKLLFMKDCDMKDIRQNIFAFKGFPFGADSQEFKQRKMYLEYLTFHSLRKISSVLTTKNVDLRNSTKHELSTHLTKVLTEYTNTYMEAEAQEASSQAEEITAQANKAAVAAAEDPNVEKIVVTPVIEGFQAASTNDSTLPKVVDIRSQSKVASPKTKGKSSVTSSVAKSSNPSTSATSQPRKKAKKAPEAEKPITQTFEKIIIPTVDQPEKQRRRKKANPTQRISEAEALTKAEQMGAAMQFQDIHLPEVENLVRSYQQNPSLMSTLCARPQQPAPAPPPPSNLGAVDNIRANYRAIIEQQKAGGHNIGSHLGTIQFPLQMSYPQVRQNIAPPNVTIGMPPRPSVPFQIIRPFSMQPPIQNLYFNRSILNSSSPPLEPIYKDEEPGDYVGSLPVECILTEGGSGEPAAKKPKLAQLLTAPQGSLTARNIPQPTQPVQPIKKPVGRSSLESSDTSMKPSTSFHLKIRDAMTKASEDEEDCDKPLATLVGHPNDKVLKQQICEIVENTDLQDITINGVIQKIFNMYPKFNLNYRKEFIKSTLRSLLYRLGEQEGSKSSESDCTSVDPDSSVSTSGQGDSTKSQVSSPTKVPASWSAASRLHKS